MQEDNNKRVIRDFSRIFKNEHNVNGVSHFFDQNFVHHFRIPLPLGFEGLGDKVVERSSATATHKGAMMGTPPTNKQVHWFETNVYRLQNGKIAELWGEASMLELLQQIGSLPQLG